VANQEQGCGALVTIIEPTPRPKEPTSAAALPTGPIAGRVRTARPPRARYGSPELKVKRGAGVGGDRNGNGSPRGTGLYDVSDAKPRLPADLRRPRPKRSASASSSQLEQRRADVHSDEQSGTEPALDEVLLEPTIRMIMKRDNVTGDQLVHLIKIASRHSEPGGSVPPVDPPRHVARRSSCRGTGSSGRRIVTERCLGLPGTKCAGCAHRWDADGG
jgi:hypothetical protein